MKNLSIVCFWYQAKIEPLTSLEGPQEILTKNMNRKVAMGQCSVGTPKSEKTNNQISEEANAGLL